MVLSLLGGGWKVLARLGRLIPRSLRDGAYDLIARNRYRWFGTSETCGVPSTKLQAHTLP